MPPVEIVWWNVQRCFAPRASRISTALESTPADGWTEEVYRRKIANIAAVMKAALDGREPGVLALCEVENSRVVDDLLAALAIEDLVEARAPDEQFEASDVVVLYSRRYFEASDPPRGYNVHNRFKTRDLFELPLEMRDGSDLLILANHWPSRLIQESSSLRIGLADYGRRVVESWVKYGWDEMESSEGHVLPARELLERRWNRPAIVLGDFNDEPFDGSVARVLGASRRRSAVAQFPEFPRDTGLAGIKRYLSMRPRLYNPTWSILTAEGHPPGTFVWDSEWYGLDQVMFTRGLLDGTSIRYVEGSLRVFAPETVETAEHGAIRVLTRGGAPRGFSPEAQDGVSDHLALACTVEVPGA